MFCDFVFDGLDMSRWIIVLIFNDIVVWVILFYLIMDYLFFCFFDWKLFIILFVFFDMILYCKLVLVNVLMYWCCVGVLICYYIKFYLIFVLVDLCVYRVRNRY